MFWDLVQRCIQPESRVIIAEKNVTNGHSTEKNKPTCDQNKMGRRPSRRINMTATKPPHPMHVTAHVQSLKKLTELTNLTKKYSNL